MSRRMDLSSSFSRSQPILRNTLDRNSNERFRGAGEGKYVLTIHMTEKAGKHGKSSSGESLPLESILANFTFLRRKSSRTAISEAEN